MAAVVVLGAGVLGGIGELRLSAALTTLTVLLLAEKPRLHGFVARLDEPTMLAAARFAVMSMVILPLLPEGPFGPGPGIKPRELWMLVLLFSGMSFVGYHRAAHERRGRISADGTARRPGVVDERDADVCAAEQVASAAGRPLAVGAVAASTVLFFRVSRSPSRSSTRRSCRCWRVTSRRLSSSPSSLWRWPGDRFAARRPSRRVEEIRCSCERDRDGAALPGGAVRGAITCAQWVGDSGLLASGFVLGLTDVDALTLSMTRSVSSGTTIESRVPRNHDRASSPTR